MAAKNNTYVIGCKLPSGLVIRGAGKEFLLNGAKSQIIEGGFGITRDVPADIWDEYAKNHADSKAIRNGIVFAVADYKSAQDAAKDNAQVKTGLEGVSAAQAGVQVDKD